MRGFSRLNLFSMRSFASAWDWSDAEVCQKLGRLTWSHIVELLKVKDLAAYDWYALTSAQSGWKLEEQS